jgi:hypothetical protein
MNAITPLVYVGFFLSYGIKTNFGNNKMAACQPSWISVKNNYKNISQHA